ncbi:hypothetical protein PRJ_1819 [Pseudomonas sp. XWY-1]|nr:hypothetical protein PRJ_1819 [Pseudomonas sp. XWY-1]
MQEAVEAGGRAALKTVAVSAGLFAGKPAPTGGRTMFGPAAIL